MFTVPVCNPANAANCYTEHEAEIFLENVKYKKRIPDRAHNFNRRNRDKSESFRREKHRQTPIFFVYSHPFKNMFETKYSLNVANMKRMYSKSGREIIMCFDFIRFFFIIMSVNLPPTFSIHIQNYNILIYNRIKILQ